MSNNRSLLQTKNFKLPSPTHPERRSPITISLHSTQRSNIFTPKFEAESIDRKKSMPLACERKLKARIMEIIGEKNQSMKQKNDNFMRASNGHKYSRSYIHYKVICREKAREGLPSKSDTLMKIRSICESKLISLPQKQSISSIRKDLKQLRPVLPESPKVKIFTSKNPFDIPNLKHYRTQSYEVQGKQKRPINFEPWNNEQQSQGQSLSGFLEL